MKVQVTSIANVRKAALHAVLLPEGTPLKPATAAGKTAAAILRRKEWTPKFRKTLLVFGADGRERLLLVGLGKEQEVTAERLRRAVALALGQARKHELKSLGIELLTRRVKAAAAGSALAEGVLLASFVTPANRKETEKDVVKGLTVRLGTAAQEAAFRSGVERGVAVAEAANLARDLAERPGNEMTPTILARRAAQMARREQLKSRVFRVLELERRKMGGILGVAKGSSEPPCLIELTYRPRRFKKTVCLVGKGLTFDSGGISLKPSANMHEMKYDMCGGAAVIGAMQAVARLKPNVRVIGIVPASENMPDASAQKPGDTLVTASGLTVEVLNTDAEGRLILADGLHHATRHDPDCIIDLATLTGACVIALGHDAAGLYSNDEKLQAELKKAADESGDPAWPMPLFPEYQEDLKSQVADLKNIGGREGGAGSAAAFLSRFAGDHKWAHLDIAGTAYGGRNRDYLGKGATGAGVRLLVSFIESLG